MSELEFDTSAASPPVLSSKQWRERLEQHRARAQRWTLPALERRSLHVSHPMADFLFTYYAFPLAKLEQWHPGWGVALEGDAHTEWPPWWQRHYVQCGKWRHADPATLRDNDWQRLQRAAQLLQATAERAPCFSCYGLHEWAMVYRTENVRHGEVAPLRLSPQQIAEVVDSRSIRCSHFDAFRFFTAAARPLNLLSPQADTRQQFEQPGCVHANMDLYKWAFQGGPWVPGELLLQAFELALELRELDMRASPYDLSAWQLDPICIETVEGRRHYEREQRRLAERAQQVRLALLEIYRDLLKGREVI